MRIKKRYLPSGWYPGTETRTRARIEGFLAELGPAQDIGVEAVAGILPHAGWDFSGKLATDVMRRMGRRHATTVVVGGHLGPNDGIYAAFEDAFETPLGVLDADTELLKKIGRRIDLIEDRVPDNTVEVQLPIIKYLFPESRLVALRASPSALAVDLGTIIFESAAVLERRVIVLGSTDLTHYGESYGFMPQGTGEAAVKWVKEVNDRRLIDALLEIEAEKAIELALSEKSACSPGAAAAAASFARAHGVRKGRLLDYSTSWEIMPSSSFVGYAAILYP